MAVSNNPPAMVGRTAGLPAARCSPRSGEGRPYDERQHHPQAHQHQRREERQRRRYAQQQQRGLHRDQEGALPRAKAAFATTTSFNKSASIIYRFFLRLSRTP